MCARQVPLHPFQSYNWSKCARVTVTNTVTLCSEMEPVAHVDSRKSNTWLFEGIACPMLVSRALVVPHQCNVVVRVVNTELTPVRHENC